MKSFKVWWNEKDEMEVWDWIAFAVVGSLLIGFGMLLG